MPPKFRVLVLAERGDQHEAFVVAALAWLKSRSSAEHFQFDIFEAPVGFDNQLLAKYQVILQLNYPPYRWSDEAKAAFEDYIENGRGGWVGMHHATLLGEFDGYPMWTWFSDFMGGIRFKNYIAQRASGTVVVEDRSHPCFRGLPATFVVDEEEWYTFDKSPASECPRAGQRRRDDVRARVRYQDGRSPGGLVERSDEGPECLFPDGTPPEPVEKRELHHVACERHQLGGRGRIAAQAPTLCGMPHEAPGGTLA